ncbi:uncharacterized protein LOC135960949 isoform X2 [Calliphora vicina]|uniref:uncharacterized protein LOC135960949 isoform X2 n=1 Tax=Calliphora vicina TaxID=7373 RepID=UPI00325B154F
MDCILENAFTNTDIWENIFQYFNLREQIHLTHVCGLFRHIITSTWKIKCKQLKLYPIDANAVLVTNHVDNIERYNAYSDPMYKLGYNDCKIADVANKSSILLNCDEVRELLDMNFSNVNKLQILEEKSEAENESTIFSFLIQNQFTELKTLNLFGIYRLSVENLKSIKMSCPQLNTLILSHCNREHGVLQDHNGISTIASMKMLKTLIVREKHIKYELNHIIDVIIKLQHVAQLVFKINIVGNNSDIISEKSALNRHENMCELISVNLDVANKMSIPVITKSILRNFENLGVLAMSSSNSPLSINRNVLEDLTKSYCKSFKENPNSVMDMFMAARQYCNQLNEMMYLKL